MRSLSGASLAFAMLTLVSFTSSVGCAKVGEIKAKKAFKGANQAYQTQDYRKAAELYEETIAAVPIPVVAFLSPQVDLHEIKADDYLNRCGEPRQLVNRDVSVDRSACVPAAVASRIFTLGIYQWCPSRVDYSADVAG